jgi:hypothetical protein
MITIQRAVITAMKLIQAGAKPGYAFQKALEVRTLVNKAHKLGLSDEEIEELLQPVDE